MARGRWIKPELRTSLTVAAWPREVRYAWVLLWGYLDDYGRGKDDLRLILADLFPLDRDITERKIDRWLDLMCQPGPDDTVPPLCRYEVEGRRYLHAIKFRKRAGKWRGHQNPQHPTDSRIPPCPLHDLPEPLTNDSRIPPERTQNLSRTPPEPLRNDSPPRAGGGSGLCSIPPSEAPPEPATPIHAGLVVQAWTDAITESGTKPSNGMRGQVGKLAKELLAAGNPPDRVMAAARQAGHAGYATIDRELAAMNGSRRPAAVGGVDPSTGRRWE